MAWSDCVRSRDMRAWAEINLDNLEYNIKKIRELSNGRELMAIIKADAYGHGSVTIANKIKDVCDFFAVACIKEAIELSTSKNHNSGFVSSASVRIDTSLVNAGSTWLVIDLDNPNVSSSSYSCRLIIKLTVVESEITLEEWNETIIFDVEKISGVDYFAVTIWDKTYVTGSTNEEYQSFDNLNAVDSKVVVNIKFIQGHVYTVSLFGFVEEDGTRYDYVLGESLGQGVGQDEEDFSRYKNGELVFLTPNESLTIIASAE